MERRTGSVNGKLIKRLFNNKDLFIIIFFDFAMASKQTLYRRDIQKLDGFLQQKLLSTWTSNRITL